MTDIRALDRRALKITETIVGQVSADQLDLPTPCSEWALGQLLAHMAGQNHGFAAAARGEASDVSVWADRPVGAGPGAAFAESAAVVTAAFAEDGVLGRRFWLPEIRTGLAFPAPTAISFHFIDYVVHGWDVARSIGVPAEFDADLLDAAAPIAGAVPDGPSRQGTGAAFQPGVKAATGAPALDRIVATLGRNPDWPDGDARR